MPCCVTDWWEDSVPWISDGEILVKTVWPITLLSVMLSPVLRLWPRLECMWLDFLWRLPVWRTPSGNCRADEAITRLRFSNA